MSPDDRIYFPPKSKNGAGQFRRHPIHNRLYHHNGTKFGSSTHELTQNIINSRLQGDQGPIDDQAKIAYCSARIIRRHQWNVLLFGSTKAPSNGVGRLKTVIPPMLDALCDKLAIFLCMRLKDMVTFLRSEFEVELTRFSIRKALEDAGWSKKATQNIAQIPSNSTNS
jgi:hypothetical protein